MDIPCTLCECMISRFRLAHHQLSKECKAIQDIENQTTKPITYRRVDGHMKKQIMISTNHNCFNKQIMIIYVV